MAKKTKTATAKAAPKAPEAPASPAAEATVTTAPPPKAAPSPAEQQAIDKILADARKACEDIILGGAPVAGLGTPSSNEDEKTERFQRDRLPGKYRKDRTYVPEFVYDEHTNVDRKVLLHGDYKYMLVDVDTIDSYINNGYKHCIYDGGSRSGLGPRGFLGTGDAIFRRTIEGYCQRADCRLMYVDIRLWDIICQENEEATAKRTVGSLGAFANAGYNHGIRTHIQQDGKELT